MTLLYVVIQHYHNGLWHEPSKMLYRGNGDFIGPLWQFTVDRTDTCRWWLEGVSNPN